MEKLKVGAILFLFILLFFSFPAVSQNFDYQLQNSLERIYLNSESGQQQEDFSMFRKTFFAEGYSSFDYLYKILEKNKKLENDYRVFFQQVDTTQNDIYKNTVKGMLNKKEFANAWAYSFDYLFHYLSDMENFLPFVLKYFSNIYLVLFYFLIILGFLFLLRFVKLLMYDIENFLEKKNLNNSLALYLGLLVTLFFPVFLTIHIKYLPIYWVILFFLYTSMKEKIIIYISLVILFVVSFTGIYMNSFSKYFYKDKVFYYESLTSPFSGVSKDRKTKDDFSMFTQGVSLLRSGDAVDSIKVFKGVKPDSIFYKYALNNIGVAYILLSRPKLAINFFDESIKNGLKLSPNVNKFYLNTKLYNIVESEEALKKAYLADTLKISEWLKLNIKDAFPLIAVPDFKEILYFVFKDFSLSKTSYSIQIPVFILIFLLLLIMIHFLSRDMSVTRPCKKCGTPFKVYESQNDKLCNQCALMYKQKSDVISNEMVEHKRREVRFYSTVKRSFEIGLGLILPGFYNVCVLKRVFSGFFIFFFFMLLLLDSLKAYKSVENILLISPLLAMLGLIYLINLINVFFEREED